MNVLVDYIQPLTNWLQHNPHWSLFITFIISLTESLAIIGSIIPGSVTMTAIGILAGSGIMRIDFTLLAAIIGAVAGDSLSYTLGYLYSDHLVDIWPFRKYPKWLLYGKEFFAKHGGKSILIGRFIGPLRSIIPVIAGILHMKQWRFLLANLISAIGWALLYIMPGVLIGTASNELSAQDATRLFILIFILLAGVWLISLIIKWLISSLNSFLKLHLHALWLELKNRSFTAPLVNAITPNNEKYHYATASRLLTLLLCIFCFLIFLGLTIQAQWISSINHPSHLFIQSIHTFVMEVFFIFCSQMTATITIITLCIIFCFWFIYHKNPIAIIYLITLTTASFLLTVILSHCINTQRPNGLLTLMRGSSFPATHITIATAVYGFLLFYMNKINAPFTNTLRTIVFTILGLSGFATLYLGDYWLTDIISAFFLGTALSLICCFIYRKNHLIHIKIKNPGLMMSSFLLGIFISTVFSTYLNFNTISYNHTPYHKEFSLSKTLWWNQSKPILPVYRLSRIGKRISLLNIEYSGDLNVLEQNLELNGWKAQKDSFVSNLLTWINRHAKEVQLPLLTQLYENKAPSLVMTYTNNSSKLNLELRIWESNYNLYESNRPLWIGSIHPSAPINNKITNNPGYYPYLIDVLAYINLNKKQFSIKEIILSHSKIKKTNYPTQPKLILIMMD